MKRVLFFLLILAVPVIFGWWLFVPLAIFCVYLAKLPYEIMIAGMLLDRVYYFGGGFISQHRFFIFSILLILLALFLSERLHWRKVI